MEHSNTVEGDINRDDASSEAAGSKFYAWSIGHVAANKERGSLTIEVTPTEKQSLMDGELTDNVTELEVAGTRPDGSSYASKATVGQTIQAIWLPGMDPNRITAPDVRRGMQVMLYKFGDGKEVFWMTLRSAAKLFRLETATYVWNADPNNASDPAKRNCYLFEVSSHDKHLMLFTSKTNGEQCEWEIVLNGGTGQAYIGNDNGEHVLIDATEQIVELRNSMDTVIQLNKGDIYLKCSGDLIEEIGGTRRRTVVGADEVSAASIKETSAGEITSTAAGPRTVNAAGINHNSSGTSTSRSTGVTQISGSRVEIIKG